MAGKITQFFKQVADSLAGQAKKAKESLEVKGGLQPILSLESRLPLPKLKQLIDRVSERFILQSLPNLAGKTVLEMGESPLSFQQKIAEKKPKFACGLVLDNPVVSSGGAVFGMILKGTAKALPFEKEFFDCVVAGLATPRQGDVIAPVKEVGRVLAREGTALILDFHPFGLYAKTGTERLRSLQATVRGLEDYYKMCRLAGLAIVDVHEGFVDDTLRNQFITPEEMKAFREIKGTPLVLFLVARKVK